MENSAASTSKKPKVADPATVRAAVTSHSGTESYYGKVQTEVAVAGVSGSIQASLSEGDSRSGSYELLSGHWITGEGQVVVPSRFLERTSTKLGDAVRVTYEKETANLRIVGESFDTSGSRLEIHADMADFKSAEPSTFPVETKPGVSAHDYTQKVAAVVQPLGGDATTGSESGQEGVLIVMAAMAVLLALMLITVAALGVLNSVVLDTRERIHDLGVCKAIGMSPRQTMSLVLASVGSIGVIGVIGGLRAARPRHAGDGACRGHQSALVGPRCVRARSAAPAGAGRSRDRAVGRAGPGRLGGQGAYGHCAAHRVASGGARTVGADPPGSRGLAARQAQTTRPRPGRSSREGPGKSGRGPAAGSGAVGCERLLRLGGIIEGEVQDARSAIGSPSSASPISSTGTVRPGGKTAWAADDRADPRSLA
ncbi:ABC transporter permease [Streptomyces pratens]|uniref:ABC transporter permease n=1 Tax=Streptomyces pratens TaxID=887456 RepID=A0ABW1LYU0_9ACTN